MPWPWLLKPENAGFHKWGPPIAGWFIRENPSINDYKWMIWG